MPSLYANLLNSNPSATISSAPVKYSFKDATEDAPEQKKTPDAALRFQPVKRPQVVQKQKPRPVPSSSSPDKLPEGRKQPPGLPVPAASGSIENWLDQDGDAYSSAADEYLRRQEEERQRRKNESKKRKKKNQGAREVDFDAIYDPEQPVRLADYNRSEEKVQAEHDWKQRLHAHQIRRKAREERSLSERRNDNARTQHKGFAPPASFNFGPPAEFGSAPYMSRRASSSRAGDDYEPPRAFASNTGDDAYARRAALTSRRSSQSSQSMAIDDEYEPPPAFSMNSAAASTQHFQPAHTAAPSISKGPVRYEPQTAPPAPSAGTISRAPVRYEQATKTQKNDADVSQPQGGLGASNAPGHDVPISQEDEEMQDDDADDAPRSNRPGQKGFAKRLLQKYGWKEGEGLGASGSGITTILRHQTEKRKKRPDAEGGGWAKPAGMGRIVGGKRAKTGESEDPADQWSVVVKMDGMVDDMNLDSAIEDHGLLQAIGEGMAKFGHVERLFIDRSKLGREPVFIKYTSALSAYRAIQASNEKDFLGNGRIVRSAFFDADKFEEGSYD